jgi:hypothetical protein
MNNKQRHHFVHSENDFPCGVTLGGEAPSWGLSRWEGARFKDKLIAPPAKLRFVPDGEDDFSVTNNANTLLYKGQKQSHRWTILGNNTFEYDIILKREPASNMLSLTLEGAEQFNFYRQPFVGGNPLLHGSYAVYSKARCLGQGTGKLCHIHRPKIIDSGGRWCWGDLFVADNKLYIKIPQEWLGNARYPVVVDPKIGTQTVGAYTDIFELEVFTNTYAIPNRIDGLCTGFVYIAQNDDGCRPVLYSDTMSGPKNRLTRQEQFISGAVNASKPAGWRSGTFQTQTALSAGSWVWFGMYADLCFRSKFDYYDGSGWRYQFEDFIDDGIPNVMDTDYLVEDEYGRRLSMYFEYSLNQNHVRTITQGVTLADSRKLQRGCTRLLSSQAHNNSLLTHSADYKRHTAMNCNASGAASLSRFFVALIYDTLHIADIVSLGYCFIAKITESIAAAVMLWGAGHSLNHIRELHEQTHADAETKHSANFVRSAIDGVVCGAHFMRRATMTIILSTISGIRDYLVGRFLKSKEEIVLHSRVTREIMLDSRILR